MQLAEKYADLAHRTSVQSQSQLSNLAAVSQKTVVRMYGQTKTACERYPSLLLFLSLFALLNAFPVAAYGLTVLTAFLSATVLGGMVLGVVMFNTAIVSACLTGTAVASLYVFRRVKRHAA